jgi:signal transduction histidine kinase
MDNADVKRLRKQVEGLEQEKTFLLNELEAIYRKVEEHLLASGHEREVAYQELRGRNRELQDRLEELEKAHRELQETQQMLIRSERMAAMGEMAAAIVHEIKNPLTVIIGRVELMMLVGEGVRRQDLETLLKWSEYLRDLVENILRFARHHRGKACELDLNALLTKLEAFVKPIIRHASVRLGLAPGIPRVVADPGQIEQVLMNLVLNALDAVGRRGHISLNTGRGSIQAAVEQEVRAGRPHRLAIEMEGEALTGDFVFAEVRDDGPGISEAHMGRLFEAFFTTKGAEKGTGLGLSIARTILTEWGGNILASSAEGQGASFKVFLPSARQTLESTPQRQTG